MEDAGKMDSHVSSAAAFVEGGIQDSCDDSCSICLEAFCENDPSTVTSCKHEFHLQCILEWCQRSSQCPMCWQAIRLKDPTSQELLEAVETERSIRVIRPRNAAIFDHPMLGDFELQHLAVGANDSELEERIIHHLAAAAAMGRIHRIARREVQQSRASAHGRPQFLVLSSSNPNTSSVSSVPDNEPGNTRISAVTTEELMRQADEVILPSRNSTTASSRPAFPNSRSFAGQSSMNNQDTEGPSDLQSFSESLKSRFSAVSSRYKDSITNSTRGWKERLFSRNSSMSDIGSEVRREVNAGIATVSRMIERLDLGDNTRQARTLDMQRIQGHAITETSNERGTENHANTLPSNNNMSTASSGAI